MAHLFDSLKIKDKTLRNRVAVSPMCQYSSDDGMMNDWHLVHLGARAVGGAGLVIAEATSVSPEGRISLGDAGIWSDAHVEPMRRVTSFIKSHGAVAGIQIAHAGRKASAQRPWEGDAHLKANEGAWPIIGPSAMAFGGNLGTVPQAMSESDIGRVRENFVAAAKRSLEAGYEWLELHFAHGYLAQSFYSPLANHRTDKYGGSLENRSRFLKETLSAVRQVWPERFPLTIRLGVVDYVDGGVTVEESITVIREFKQLGMDLIDVSLGFNSPDSSKVPWGPGFMLPVAAQIRKETGALVGVGWMLKDAEQANQAVLQGQADVIFLAHSMLDDPQWAYHAAKKLGIKDPAMILPVQYSNWLKRRP